MHNDGMMLLSSSVRDQSKDLEKKSLSFRQEHAMMGEQDRKKNKNYDKFPNLNLQRGCK